MDLNLEKIILAGIGSLATSYEKAEAAIDEMVKKGELTVKQGKELNEELKRKKQPEKEQSDTNEKLDAIMEELSQIKKRVHDLESKSE